MATLVVVIAAACGAAAHATFHATASEGGYTVLYSSGNPLPSGGGGPCLELVPTSTVQVAVRSRFGAATCGPSGPGTSQDLNPLQNQVGDRVAVWGLVSHRVSSVMVGATSAAVSNGTFLAVLNQPSAPYRIVALDASGRQVVTISSQQLPPVVPGSQ